MPKGELHFEGVAPVVGSDAGVVFPFHADRSAGCSHGDERFGEEFDDEFFGEVVGKVEAGRLPFGVVGFGDFGVVKEGFEGVVVVVIAEDGLAFVEILAAGDHLAGEFDATGAFRWIPLPACADAKVVNGEGVVAGVDEAVFGDEGEVGGEEGDEGGAVVGAGVDHFFKEVGGRQGGSVFNDGAGTVDLPAADYPFEFIVLDVGGGGDGDGGEWAFSSVIGGDAKEAGEVEIVGEKFAGEGVDGAGGEGADVIGAKGDGGFFPGAGEVICGKIFEGGWVIFGGDFHAGEHSPFYFGEGGVKVANLHGETAGDGGGVFVSVALGFGFGEPAAGEVHGVLPFFFDVAVAGGAPVGGEFFDGVEIVAADEVTGSGGVVVEVFGFEDLVGVADGAGDEEAVAGAGAGADDEFGGVEVGFGEDAEEGFVGGGEAGA